MMRYSFVIIALFLLLHPLQAFSSSVCVVNRGQYVENCIFPGNPRSVSASCMWQGNSYSQPVDIGSALTTGEGSQPCQSNVTISCFGPGGSKFCPTVYLNAPSPEFVNSLPDCPEDCSENPCPAKDPSVYGACQNADGRNFYSVPKMPKCEDDPYGGTYGQTGTWCVDGCVMEVHPKGGICCGPVDCGPSDLNWHDCVSKYTSIKDVPLDFTKFGLCSSCIIQEQSFPGQSCTGDDDMPSTGSPPSYSGGIPVGWSQDPDGTLIPGVPPGYNSQPSTGAPGDAGSYPLPGSGSGSSDSGSGTGTGSGSSGSGTGTGSGGSGSGTGTGSGGSGSGTGTGSGDSGSGSGTGPGDGTGSGDGGYAKPFYTPDKRMDNSKFPTKEKYDVLGNIKNPIPDPGGRCPPRWDIHVAGFILPIDFSAGIWGQFATLLRDAMVAVMWFGFFVSYLALFNWWVKANGK